MLACFQNRRHCCSKINIFEYSTHPWGREKGLPTFISPAKQVKMKSLLMKLLASSCSAVPHPHRFPSWKSQNSHGGWSPRLELIWPVWLPSKKDFCENIILVFFPHQRLKKIITHATMCPSPLYHSFTVLKPFYPIRDICFLLWA